MPKRQKAPSHGLNQQVNASVLVALPVLSEAEGKTWLGLTEQKRRIVLRDALFGAVAKGSEASVPDVLETWAKFYRKFFPTEFNFVGGEEELYKLKLPTKRKGYDRLIVVLKGLTMNGVYAVCASEFLCWRYTNDLNEGVSINDREPVVSYAVWIRDCVEADAKISAAAATSLSIKGTTLLERMLLELKFFDETGGHLDLRNVTLCSGSRDADDYVPAAHWSGGRFGIDWFESTYTAEHLNLRQVSL